MLTIAANDLVLSIVLFTLLACCAGQTAHGYLRTIYIRAQSRPLSVAYEAALLAHMMIMAAFVLGCADIQPLASINFLYVSIPMHLVLWANVVFAIITAYTAYVGIDDDELPAYADGLGWMAAVDTVFIVLCTPVAISLLQETWTIVLIADTAYFLFRTCYLLLVDRRMHHRIVSSLSVAEAMKLLPEGVLYADKHGHTIVANDSMRHCLSSVGFSVDFGKVADLWTMLNELADGDRAVNVSDSIEHDDGNWTIVRIGPDEVRLFSFEGDQFDRSLNYSTPRYSEQDANPLEETILAFGEEAHTRVIAYDVTEEVEILQKINTANADLAASQQELRASMLTLQEAAENEAMLRMRGRVHDVIGQRLSMLHRALEDEDISDEKLDQLKPLLNGILDDLSTNVTTKPADELDAIVDAFGMTCVSVVVEGDLPAEPTVAKLFVDCIREGATNAVKHAHATTVTVSLAPTTLQITNNGAPPTLPITEGTGLTHMRQSIEAANGTLQVTPTSPFTLTVTLPS